MTFAIKLFLIKITWLTIIDLNFSVENLQKSKQLSIQYERMCCCQILGYYVLQNKFQILILKPLLYVKIFQECASMQAFQRFKFEVWSNECKERSTDAKLNAFSSV